MAVLEELSGDSLRLSAARRVPGASATLLDALQVGMLVDTRPVGSGVETRVYLQCNFDPTTTGFLQPRGSTPAGTKRDRF